MGEVRMQRVRLGSEEFSDMARVHQVITDAYQVQHDMRQLGDGDPADSRFDLVGIGPVKIARMEVGIPVAIDTDHVEAYGVNTPLEGLLPSRFGSTLVEADPELAALNSPDTQLHIDRWDGPVLSFRVDMSFLEQEYERVLARPFQRLPFHVDLSTAEGRDWHRLVRANFEQMLLSESGLYDDPVFTHQLASTMVTGLLLAASPEQRDERLGTRPRIVRQVIAAIDEDPGHCWTPSELAELAGVSVRRLQQGFREYVGRTPFQYLHDARLDRAHHDLVHADADATVTDVALRWGLTHTGRFAADYRRRFGRSPSETLSRRRPRTA
jgi:AraC-like DNA-binding protein